MHRIWISSATGVVVCTILGAILLLGLEPLTTRPRTYREAVIQILDQRDIPYAGVQVTNACKLDPRDCAFLSAYTLYVEVMLERPMYGQVVCKHWVDQHSGTDCELSLAALELHNIPLPPLAHDPMWLSTFRRQLHRIDPWLRIWM